MNHMQWCSQGLPGLEDQIKEENEEKLRKMGENNGTIGKYSALAHARLRVWLCHTWPYK